MGRNDQSFLSPFLPHTEFASPTQTFQETDRNLNVSRIDLLQGIRQDDGSVQQPQLSYPSSVTIPGLEPTTQPTTPLQHPAGDVQQPFYGQGQTLAGSPIFPPQPNITNISPISVPDTRPLNYFSSQRNPPLGNGITFADIAQQSQVYGQQYHFPTPQTATPYAGPTGGTELRTRSLSDSGYMSRISGISGNTSFQGTLANIPQSPQTVSFNQLIQPGFTPGSQYTPDPQPETSSLLNEPASQPKPRRKRKERKVFCPEKDCPWTGRCPSERKKHIHQKHTKPHACDFYGCTMTFGSNSDLKRHKESRHPSERTPQYKCFATKKKSCLESTHIFTRKDNFRTHLVKTHGLTENEVAEHIVLSNKWLFDTKRGSMETREKTLQSPVQFDDHVQSTHPQPQYPASVDMNLLRQLTPADYNPVEDALGEEEYLDMARRLEDDMESIISNFCKSSGDLSIPGIQEPVDYNGPSTTPGDSYINLADNLIARSSNQQTSYLPQIENSGEREWSLREVERNFQQPTTAQTVVEKEKYPCAEPGCNASFKIPSLLKKHRKRHRKPYGCTFKDCYQTFGSKADWKRHESSRHSHLERWRCGDPDITDSSRSCAKMFERRSSYEFHLKVHGIDNEDEILQRLNGNRIGGDCQFRFWCGFCNALVPVFTEGFAALIERFDHIYNEHFEKGQDISSWVLPDSHLTKGEAKPQSLGRALQYAASATETTISESVDSKSLLEDVPEIEETGAAPLQRNVRQIRTFRASSRGRRSRVSMSPPKSLKRRREHSRPTPEAPSAPTAEVAPELQLPTDQFSRELPSLEEIGTFNFDDLFNDDTWFLGSPTEPS
ncbi:hypothetical protein H112_06600 [Trichophyton rubrum D6]|uniref:C2H2-type domain-containing protein n=2 Tax=Trichophyton rubrum TaxID=5551 RepID=A0A178F152_TRIRU|nr:hypothetical protein H100_06617 [Trichophyton rubrum MR850]EZF39247.1 hypothetical protein H102_06583 [Trichophyton rubrum CBS 100081]EZF49894.1 hypothetical protein H103_06608 [Trichophyton rubrum CBS 288.86]EZF60530.1 hypothetical protein H104_06563 [Trichophyton rubrum CBS 289.86]EZF81722.1 hypothetical protein H110_06604 [Trichophyton rubrum MR1448]EZF92366.1 hypothetical protein H113_06653 [Trichophyton rubrum MR1459]EZG02916.1 hypothetical protein H106_06449 [Trichophyton rubrum CBS 